MGFVHHLYYITGLRGSPSGSGWHDSPRVLQSEKVEHHHHQAFPLYLLRVFVFWYTAVYHNDEVRRPVLGFNVLLENVKKITWFHLLVNTAHNTFDTNTTSTVVASKRET